MALGLGQMLGMGLLSQFMGGFGGDEKKKQLGGGGQQGIMDIAKLQAQQQQQGQVANNQQGFMGGLSGISNSMFQGMSPEQVARLGLGFNTMRLEPDANLATAMRERIAFAQEEKQKQQGIERAISYLSALPPSKAFPNGRTDLISLLKADLITPAEAIQSAIKVEKPTALTEKFNKLEALKLKYGSADKIPPFQLQLLNISQKEVNSIEEFEFYKEGLDEGETPISYLEFLEIDSPKTTVTIEAAQKSKEQNAFWDKYNEVAIPEIIEWQTKGADVKGNIVKLKGALQALEDPNNLLTGAIIGQMPDFIMAFLNPEAIDTREAIEAVVQRNLKAVLGGQFTEREGEKLIKRAYNPTLSREYNAKRLRILIEQMERASMMQDARSAWIKDPANNGSLRGFTGELPTMEDFWTALSANEMGDVVCDSGEDNVNRKCYTYQGGDDKSESSWKLVE